MILEAAAQTLDFSRPVAVLLFGGLHFFPPGDDPAGIAGADGAARGGQLPGSVPPCR